MLFQVPRHLTLAKVQNSQHFVCLYADVVSLLAERFSRDRVCREYDIANLPAGYFGIVTLCIFDEALKADHFERFPFFGVNPYKSLSVLMAAPKRKPRSEKSF